jgi:hypothetical protein
MPESDQVKPPELSELFPLAQTLTLQTDQGPIAVEIKQIQTKELPAALASLGPFLADLAALEGAVRGGVDASETVSLMLAANAERFVQLVATAARLPRERVDALELDDLIRLAAALFKVNRRFFQERLLPALQGVGLQADNVAGVLSALLSPGAKPAPSSAAAGTP